MAVEGQMCFSNKSINIHTYCTRKTKRFSLRSGSPETSIGKLLLYKRNKTLLDMQCYRKKLSILRWQE